MTDPFPALVCNSTGGPFGLLRRVPGGMDSYPVQTSALPRSCLCFSSSFQICVHVILGGWMLSPCSSHIIDLYNYLRLASAHNLAHNT
jgi:hypothetical protein